MRDEAILKTIPSYKPLEEEDWICPRCGRDVPYRLSLCPCWTRDEMIEAGIDPAAHGLAQTQHTCPLPVEPLSEAKDQVNNKSDWDIWVEFNGVLLHQRVQIAQFQGHLIYLQKALQKHLGYRQKYLKRIELDPKPEDTIIK